MLLSRHGWELVCPVRRAAASSLSMSKKRREGKFCVPERAASHLDVQDRKSNFRIRQVFNYLAGSFVRIFTTFQEVDDKLILYGFVAGFVLNAVLALQMAWYWNAPSAKALGKRKEKVAAKASSSTADAGASSTSSGVTPKKAPTTRRRG